MVDPFRSWEGHFSREIHLNQPLIFRWYSFVFREVCSKLRTTWMVEPHILVNSSILRLSFGRTLMVYFWTDIPSFFFWRGIPSLVFSTQKMSHVAVFLGFVMWEVLGPKDLGSGNSAPGNSAVKWPFWDGEFTWPELKGCWWPTQRLGIKRSRLESPGIHFPPQKFNINLYHLEWIDGDRHSH